MVVGDFAEERDTMIIGAGPGGYVAAIRPKSHRGGKGIYRWCLP